MKRVLTSLVLLVFFQIVAVYAQDSGTGDSRLDDTILGPCGAAAQHEGDFGSSDLQLERECRECVDDCASKMQEQIECEQEQVDLCYAEDPFEQEDPGPCVDEELGYYNGSGSSECEECVDEAFDSCDCEENNCWDLTDSFA